MGGARASAPEGSLAGPRSEVSAPNAAATLVRTEDLTAQGSHIPRLGLLQIYLSLKQYKLT